MRQVSATGHQALEEMRRLLGVLRTEDGPESRQPQPGMAQLDELFDQVRATGLTAGLTVTGTPATLSPGAELTLYRIVQEALTNPLKHAADPTQVSVAIAYRPHATRNRSAPGGGDGPVQHRDRREAGGVGGHGEDARGQHPDQARPAQPRAGRHLRLRHRPGPLAAPVTTPPASPPPGPWSARPRSDTRRDRGRSNGSRMGAVSAASGSARPGRSRWRTPPGCL